jgi:hypothetical protein
MGPVRAIINQRNVEQIINERCIIYRTKPPDCARFAAASAFACRNVLACPLMISSVWVTSAGCVYSESVWPQTAD